MQKIKKTRSKSTKDLLYTDSAVITEVQSWKNKLEIAWIDCKKAYDMTPNSRIAEVRYVWSS